MAQFDRTIARIPVEITTSKITLGLRLTFARLSGWQDAITLKRRRKISEEYQSLFTIEAKLVSRFGLWVCRCLHDAEEEVSVKRRLKGGGEMQVERFAYNIPSPNYGKSQGYLRSPKKYVALSRLPLQKTEDLAVSPTHPAAANNPSSQGEHVEQGSNWKVIVTNTLDKTSGTDYCGMPDEGTIR
ncbi:unnamed protein product [Cyprideis torosa]|uniref:Uncharacterized protein n=1 Tax=Cyprideis torosa TaxID=163714 RepID=A0A7R8W1F9_9CRUS|nr:unnamed protein product [Cyprideis torosa]CAG0880879.1 unnamed protein product [Cyprideis torosa]